MVGVAQRGRIGVAVRTSSFDEWQAEYGSATIDSLDLWASAQQWYEGGGGQLKQRTCGRFETPLLASRA